MAVTSKNSNGYWIHVINQNDNNNESKDSAADTKTQADEQKDDKMSENAEKKEETTATATKTEEQKTVGNPAESKTGIREEDLLNMDISSINREWEQITKLMEA